MLCCVLVTNFARFDHDNAIIFWHYNNSDNSFSPLRDVIYARGHTQAIISVYYTEQATVRARISKLHHFCIAMSSHSYFFCVINTLIIYLIKNTYTS